MLKWKLGDKLYHKSVQFIILPQICTANIGIAVPPLGLQWARPPMLNAVHLQRVQWQAILQRPCKLETQEVPANQLRLLPPNGRAAPFISVAFVAIGRLER